MLRGLEYVFDYAQDHHGWILSIGVLLWLLPLALVLRRWNDPRWWIVAGTWALVVVGVVGVGGDGLFMYRFMVPTVALWGALLAALPDERGLVPRVALPGVVAFFALAGLLPDRTHLQYVRFQEQRDGEVPDWSAVGRWLRANAEPGESVACVPIGAVGYYSGLPVLDMLGLTDRHIAHLEMESGEGWAGHEKHDGAYILSRKPTYLLLGNVRVLAREMSPETPRFFYFPTQRAIYLRERDLVEDPRTAREYEPRVAELDSGRILHYLRRRPER